MAQYFSNIYLTGAILCAGLRFGITSPLDPAPYDIEREMVMTEIGSDFKTYEPSGDEFGHEFGKRYDSSRFSRIGAKGDRGYEKLDDFEKAISGKHNSDGQKSHYNDVGARKSGHLDNSNYYKDKNTAVKASKGADYASSQSFSKGSKTSGFHNVHHKEEYKKDQKFYDEKQQSGQYRRYGDFGATLKAAAGNLEKGERHDAGYRNAEAGKRGFENRGSLYDRLKKYNAANGYDGYYGNYGNYKQSGEAERGHQYGS